MPRTPLEAYAFDARFGKRSVFILDRSAPASHLQGKGSIFISQLF